MKGNPEFCHIAELENKEAVSRQTIAVSAFAGLILAMTIFLTFWM